MSGAWGRGSSRRWRRVRDTVLLRDGHRCQLALPGVWRTRTQDGVHCLGVARSAHHLHGKGKCPGCRADRLDHLVAACMPCNLRVGEPGAGHDGVRAPNPAPRKVTQW